ncbi:uncharacterized protein LOC129595791 [Paramacrobiotus metropolitanus]|uniref:uncharacterized protein LOC129595791 n=1 Tax=Paramacrobiotus metropolitanus TaxID=2943436 RepID=UPI0024460A94|nr:uncharacterized protein LOC129595791 [Paramacrobiotus metropolitanus]
MLTEEITRFVGIDDVGVLPPAMLLEVFSQLDTITQTRLRTVCAAWNCILELPTLTACIVVTGFYNNLAYLVVRNQALYFLMATVFKCFRKSTQHIVVDDRKHWMDTGDFLMLTDVIRYVGRTTASRLRAIHVLGLRLELRFGNAFRYKDKCQVHRYKAEDSRDFKWVTYRLFHFTAACGDLPCDALHLVNCTLDLEYAWRDEELEKAEELELSVELAAAQLPLSDDLGSALWDAMERSLPLLDGKQLARLAMWLKSVTAGEGRGYQSGLAGRVLCATQTADPRPTSHYRKKEWCVTGLKDLQLDKLSSVALHFLVELIDFFNRPSTSDDDSYDS